MSFLDNIILTENNYRLALLANPAYAFPQLVASWVLFFFACYQTAHHLFTPANRFSLGLLAPNAPVSNIEEWANRATSTLHACMAAFGCLSWYQNDKHLLKVPTDYAFLNSFRNDFYLAITLGYLSFDLMRLCYYKWLQPSSHEVSSAPIGSMLFHHLTIILAYTIGVQYHYGTVYMCLFLNNEITTPFLNARFLMGEHNLKKHWAYGANEAIFVIGFFISRIVGNLFILRHVQMHLPTYYAYLIQNGLPTGMYYLLPVLAYAHCGLQVYWFGLLLRMAFRKMKNGQPTGVPMVSPAEFAKTAAPSAPALESKAAKVLGVETHIVTEKSLRVGIAHDKAAVVLGLQQSPPSSQVNRRKRSPIAS
ncbi:TLC domain-containing protein [Fimicolochytrium jonesii]|uniref:TLC domain-containing protein n=1 Tax=Fimicolochytrium jonesii TaxID=1396493 RepID=UPI0022FDC08E|nr:TLC domain-containing protein [Fimicolochytrium jonesii]KAI8826108.1 TLC domain-containing protein [Fimicolochytrium jonesii]